MATKSPLTDKSASTKKSDGAAPNGAAASPSTSAPSCAVDYNPITIAPDDFDAVLFDMDGIVTRTATVHFTAWKSLFDSYLKEKDGDKFVPFTQDDYLRYVDGKPRQDGIESFLQSRKIELPAGNKDDAPGVNSVAAMGLKKDDEFLRLVHTNGVEAYETTLVLIRALRSAGVKTALVTASKNGEEVLKVAKITQLFDAIVTGVDAETMHLKGKPAPDVFLEAAKRLSAEPARTAVVEDAEAGVASGKAGGFAMVIGVARQNNVEALKEHGATTVVRDLAEVTVQNHGGDQSHGTAMSDLDVSDANWIVSYDSYEPEHEAKRESLCALGNGKFFVRGAAAESKADDIHYPGAYVAGGYNSVWLEGSDGSKFEREEVVNLQNWLYTTFKIEGGEESAEKAWFSLDTWEVLEYSQKLNLKEGILYRTVKVSNARGQQTQVAERRFVHMKYSHIAGIEVTITPLNWSGKFTLRTGIDATVVNSNDPIDPRFKATKHLLIQERESEKDILFVKSAFSGSGLIVASAARVHVLQGEKSIEPPRQHIIEDEFVAQDMTIDGAENVSTTFQKTVALYTSRDRGMYEAGSTAREVVVDIPDFEQLIRCQREAWRSLWTQFDLFIETTEEYSKLIPSLLLHLNSFHSLQTASTHTVDLDNGVPARGWTGEGYQGHVFWDELFVFPFITMRMPNISASLLKYRYRRLREARKIATSYGALGACFPWQSAGDGKERTPDYWWMASNKKWIRDYTHLELHVNGAIAYIVWKYFMVTMDTSFMYSYGSEILLEIARFFSTFAKFNEEKKKYEILGVIGPDEFHNGYPNFKTPGVNNNAYTNVLASWTIGKALELLQTIPADHRAHISGRLHIEEKELKHWEDVSTNMYLPIMECGLLAQFDGYEQLEEFPQSEDKKAETKLDNKIDLEELNKQLKQNDGYLNSFKISKQPDVLMLGFLFSQRDLEQMIEKLGYSKECVSLEKLTEYYIPRTANQSTLSRVAHAWVLSRLSRLKGTSGERDKEEDKVFYEALGSDYYDVASRGTTSSGIHMGAMAGTVDIVQRCYTGLELRDNVLWLDPLLPQALVRLSFSMHYRGQSLNFDINHDRVRLHARHSSADSIIVGYHGETFELKAGDTKTIALTHAQNGVQKAKEK